MFNTLVILPYKCSKGNSKYVQFPIKLKKQQANTKINKEFEQVGFSGEGKTGSQI